MIRERMQAVIVEVRGRHAVALTEAGSFLRVPNKQYQPGQTMTLDVTQTNEPRVRNRSRLGSYANMVAGLVLLAFGGLIGYMAPVGVVSLDVNPSFEYSINCFDRVLDISAVNDDAKALLPNIDEQALLYQPVDDALETTILVLRENGYLSAADKNNVVIAASSYEARHTEQIVQRLETRIAEQSDLKVYAISVSSDEVKSAHALGTSAGKQYVLHHLTAEEDKVVESAGEDWLNQPMQRIQREVQLQQKVEKLRERGESLAKGKHDQAHDNNGNDKNEKDDDKDQDRPEDSFGTQEPSDSGRKKGAD